MLDAFALAVSDTSSPLVEFRFRHRDGSWRVLEAIGKNLSDDPIIAGVMVNCRDVTERRIAQESLRISEERLRTIVTSAPIVIWAIDEGGNLGWKSGGFWETNEDAIALKCAQLWSSNTDTAAFKALQEYSFACGVGLPGRAWESGEPAWIIDVTQDPNFSRAPFCRAE